MISRYCWAFAEDKGSSTTLQHTWIQHRQGHAGDGRAAMTEHPGQGQFRTKAFERQALDAEPLDPALESALVHPGGRTHRAGWYAGSCPSASRSVTARSTTHSCSGARPHRGGRGSRRRGSLAAIETTAIHDVQISIRADRSGPGLQRGSRWWRS